MSGYLQRLVNTAAGRADAVHPRIGSIFSPPRGDASSPLRFVEESEIVTPAQPGPNRQTSSADVSDAEPPRRVTREPVYAPLLPAAEAPSRDAAPPETPASRTVLTGGTEPVAVRVLPADEPPRKGHDAATETPIAPEPARLADDPLRSWTNANRTGGVAARFAERRRISREQTDRTARQPDDIEIHIGRIEVVAVPPAAPRPQKAADRSLNLDEYLSRRDRRPR
ncbi:MAG TPA: hypothetical protein VKD69_26880 [Vicinamibacterales bacterium]|nr:hypothetical protein [Vicinamibacterales bacterium]